jgi:hypothetical protein
MTIIFSGDFIVNLPLHAYRNLSPADKIKFIVVLHILGLLLIAFGFLVGLSFRRGGFQLSPPAMQAQPAPASSIPLSIPLTGNCTTPTLVLGTTTFQIQDLARRADGSLAVPGDTSGIAYRVDETGTNKVFILSPTPQNISVMATISIGSPVTVKGTSCAPDTYSLLTPQAGALDDSAFASSSSDSITIFFPTVSSGAGFVYKGRLVKPGG